MMNACPEIDARIAARGLAPDLSRIGLKWTPVLHPEDPLAPRR